VWEMDPAELSSLSKNNGRHKYILKVIDIFSGYAWSLLLKDKPGTSNTLALKFLFQNIKPITIQSDKGTEFVNANVQQYLKRQRVNFHTTHNPDIKGAVIERFNKSLKTRMYKYFIKHNTHRYLDIINKLLTVYNISVHSTIGMPPSKVNSSNIHSLWKRINSLWVKIPRGRVKFKVGHLVRIKKKM